jgi:peroxisomal membrane protein 4
MGGNRLQERKPGYPYRNYHSLIAGAIGGYYVWGSRNKINLQVNLYLFSRVVVALMKRYGWNLEGNETHYAWFSAAIWGAVMFMFEDQPTELQTSLRLSMEEIYRYQL